MSSKHYYDSELRKETDEENDRDPFVKVETHTMLPLEPTDGMVEAAENEMDARRQFGGRIFASDIWSVMVRAYRDGLLS